jgi:WD40 repeat protein
LVSGAGDLKLWDVASGQLLRTLSGHSSAVTSVAFSPDGQTLASGSWDHSIKLWDVASGHMIRTQKGDNFEVASVAFSPDGRTLASGGTDNIKLWDVSNLNK